MWKKAKPGIQLQIPGFGDRRIETLLTDYDGTLSCYGEVNTAVKNQIIQLSKSVDVHILTADKRAKANEALGTLPIRIHLLKEMDQDIQKRQYLKDFTVQTVAVFGNGNNDRLLFEEVKSAGGLCIAVDNGEGCALEVIAHAHIFIHDVSKALALLLKPDYCRALLRY